MLLTLPFDMKIPKLKNFCYKDYFVYIIWIVGISWKDKISVDFQLD